MQFCLTGVVMNTRPSHVSVCVAMVSILILVLTTQTACQSNAKSTEHSTEEKTEQSVASVTQVNVKLPTTLEEAVGSRHYRTPSNMERDVYRHPVQTLKFFGLKPDMTVIEISPGSGWYTEIIAPFVN